MPSKQELEQELDIVQAERDELERALHNTRLELDRVNGAAKAAGVAITIADTPEIERAELAQIRAGVETDLQALAELRNPPPIDDTKPETSLDIVRANNRERHELQQRTARANAIVSRIAAILGIDRWDDEGTELRDKVQRFAHWRMYVQRELERTQKELEETPPAVPGSDFEPAVTSHRGQLTGIVRGLNWAIDQFGPDKVPSVRHITFTVFGHDQEVDVQPTQTLAELAATVLVGGGRGGIPLDQWRFLSEPGQPLNPGRPVKDLVIPGDRVIVTTDVGHGA